MRRRVDAQQVIIMPELRTSTSSPDVHLHAKQFFVAYTLLVLLGTLLLSTPLSSASGRMTSPLDAFFTAVSASSVTGLIVVDTQDHWNLFGEVVILLLIQAGGLGFMVGASLVLSLMRQGNSLRGALMLRDGAPTFSVSEATQLSRRILMFMLSVEALGALSLTLFFQQHMPWGEALWHGVFTSVSAFCNAGFDLQGGFASLVEYDDSWWLGSTVMLLIQFGALSFIVFSDVWTKRRWKLLALDVKLVLVANAVMLLAGFGMILSVEWNSVLQGQSLSTKVLVSLFQSVTFRTAGFATMSFADAHVATVFLGVGIMMVGGASGSTAGGMKLGTVAVLAMGVRSVLRGHNDVHVFERRIGYPLVFRALSMVTLFIAAHFLLTVLLSITEGVIAGHVFGFVDLMFETMSAMATVGLTTGITPELSDPGRLVLCVGMYVGRLGPLMAVYALQRRQHIPLYRYPESAVRIG